MRIAMVGGAGLIGKLLVALLRARGRGVAARRLPGPAARLGVVHLADRLPHH
ncbi:MULTISPECIES: hypothetical protein [unclassified Isoptericola]|uniref:hypothetical protein n=1 Tax=unclassified Isoptericola TaxID=2623355 RepID=UPI003664A80E